MKYSKETTDRICKSLRELKGRVNACKEANIGYDAFLEWFKKYPEFAEAIKKAEDEARISGRGIAIMSIFKAMPNSWQAGAWWLERNFEEFIKKDKTLNENMNYNTKELSKKEVEEIAQAIKNTQFNGFKD